MPRPKQPKVSPTDVLAMRQLKETGLSWPKIARIFKIDHTTAMYHVKKYTDYVVPKKIRPDPKPIHRKPVIVKPNGKLIIDLDAGELVNSGHDYAWYLEQARKHSIIKDGCSL